MTAKEATESRRGFGSDNHSGIHPEILAAIAQANTGHAPSYGTDEWSLRAEAAFQKHFGPQAKAFFVFNGTAANVTALKALTQSFQSIFCSDVSHINVDECGAPEFFTGAKLIPIPSLQGKIRLEDLEQAFIRRGDQHYSQTQTLSLTQPTELGTLYSIAELKELIGWAKKNKIAVHLDGARLGNAAHALGLSWKELTTDLGVDVVSMGGTKNGFMMGEAVVFLNSELARDFKYLRKQAAQLPSKSRFVAAQFLAYFENDLWQKIARHSCAMAMELFEKVQGIPGVEVSHRPESNAVFARIPKAWVKPLRDTYFFYVWNEKTFECRWMTSWDTQTQDIDGFTQKLKELSR
jgi:threonine aldolase